MKGDNLHSLRGKGGRSDGGGGRGWRLGAGWMGQGILMPFCLAQPLMTPMMLSTCAASEWDV